MIGQDPLEAFKARNADASTNALAVLQKAAVEHENTFEAMIEAAKVSVRWGRFPEPCTR